MKFKALFLALLFLIIWSSQKVTAQNHGYGLIINSKYTFAEDQKIKALPFCNQKQKKKGNSTPNPFGISIHSFFYDQAYYGTELKLVSQLKVTADSIPVVIRIDSMYQNTSVMELKGSIRPNIWLFPFLNIYGIIGYTAGQVNPDIQVPYFYVEVIDGNDTLFTQRIDTSFSITERPTFHGPSFGAGATLSLGISRFFLIVDYNFTMSNPLQVDGKLYSHLLSPKLGILFGNKSNQFKGALWAGAMYFHNDQFFSGEIDVRDISKDLEPIIGRYVQYSGDIKAYDGQEWNFVLGGSWIFNKHSNLSLEAGVYPRYQATLSYNYSF